MGQYAIDKCPAARSHGNPFLYCQFCDWIEEPEFVDPRRPIPGKPPVKDEPPTHACIMRAERDVFAVGEQYLIGCVCHDRTALRTWRPGDELGKCAGGTQYPDPRTLLSRNEM